MGRRRLLLLAAAAVVGGLSTAAPARADIQWAGCTDQGFGAFQCGRTTVPIDRGGSVPGTIDLFARRLVAPSNPNATAVLFLSGGPGQAATGSAASVAEALAPALGTRDLLVYDQRGTGASGALKCDALRSARTSRGAAEGCANELGPQRAFFRTTESVADIEDLRAAAGYDKLVLYGVSYGTKVALAYATAHPGRVESLVLDSTVTPEGPDALRRSSFAASPRVLQHLCVENRCRGITPNIVADANRLVRRKRIRGRYVTARGRAKRASFSTRELYDLLELGDLNPAWRAMLPGAMRAAVLGDEAPLMRLAASMFGDDGSQVPSSGVNRALYLATVCEEVVFPWDRASGADARIDQATASLNQIPESAFFPFDRATVAGSSLVPQCYGWPNAAPPPAPPGALPRVPALLLAGEGDVRTPLEDAGAIAGRLGGQVVAVPHTGHSVLGSDFSRCAAAAVAAFFRDGSAPACPPGIEPVVAPLPRAPRRLGEVPVSRRYKGRVGRTLNAVALTQSDALVAALAAQLDDLKRVAGVRHGVILITSKGTTLRGVELVPGVRVSGTFPDQGTRAKLTVTGRSAARGRLTITRNGGASGRLGGVRIRARPRAASARGPFGGPPAARRIQPFPALTSR
jgi:pimeloyl-ACP methyl ester carboxylesterase